MQLGVKWWCTVVRLTSICFVFPQTRTAKVLMICHQVASVTSVSLARAQTARSEISKLNLSVVHFVFVGLCEMFTGIDNTSFIVVHELINDVLILAAHYMYMYIRSRSNQFVWLYIVCVQGHSWKWQTCSHLSLRQLWKNIWKDITSSGTFTVIFCPANVVMY